jgi:UDP-3-O-[3-hydroxymyristoyl] glucosamine N-acyltransferase
VSGEPGDDPEIVRVAPIEHAQAGELTFLSNPKYAGHLAATQAAAVLVAEGVAAPGKRLVVVPDPYGAFAAAVELLMAKPPRRFEVHAHATVDAEAELGENVSIGPGARVGARARIGRNTIIEANVVVDDEVIVGDDCFVHAGVVLRAGARLGNRVVLQPNVVVGGDGFGFAPGPEGLRKVPQVGGVVIGDDVEIGAGSTIDRGALGDTVIGKGTKIDNLVMIAHNVNIGEHTIVVSQTGVAGSTSIGSGCVIAGQVGIVGHLKIGDGVRIAAQSGISHDLPSGTEWAGTPAIPLKSWLRSVGVFARLPEMRRQLARLVRGRDDS